MFLSRLSEVEKKAFLELAHHIARCGGSFGNMEQEIIGRYCAEMQIDDIEYRDGEFNLDDTIAKVLSPLSQRIVLLELMALVYADGVFDKEEEKIITRMLEVFGLGQNVSAVYAQWTKAIMALTVQGEALLHI